MEWDIWLNRSIFTEIWQPETACENCQSLFCLRLLKPMRFLRIDSHFQIKVADFGLSKDIFLRNYYREGDGTKLPVKWMAPESLTA